MSDSCPPYYAHRPSKCAQDIGAQVYRQTMLLPLTLSGESEQSGREEDQPWWEEITAGDSPWAEVIPNPGEIKSHIPPSRACDPLGAGENETQYENRWSYAEAVYFHPFVQNFLFGLGLGRGEAQTGGPLRRFIRRQGFKIGALTVAMGYGVEVACEKGPATAFSVALTVERCDLYVMTPGVACLLVEVAATQETRVALFRKCELGEKPCRVLGGVDYFKLQEDRSLSLVECLALHDGLRRLYPPFFISADATKAHDIALFPGAVWLDVVGRPIAAHEQTFNAEAAEHCLQDMTLHGHLPVAPWWREILGPLSPARTPVTAKKTKGPRWRQVIDDRMPTLVFLAVEKLSDLSRGDLIRLCFADHAGDSDLPYSECFLANFETTHCYRRFLDAGTLYMASSYSFVCVAGTSEARKVLQEHMRRHYTYMFS